MPDQVHHQKRHVGDRVGGTEPDVEFDAIDDRQVVRWSTCPETGKRDPAECRRAHRTVCRDLLDPRSAHDVAPSVSSVSVRRRSKTVRLTVVPTCEVDCSKLSRALPATTSNRPNRAIEWSTLGVSMKVDDPASQGFDCVAAQIIALDRPDEARLGGEPVHLDRPLDHRASALDPNRRTVIDDRHDTEIDTRGQPAVEPNFLLAPVPPLLERAVVQELESERLLDLVGECIGHEDDRDVSLVDLTTSEVGSRIGPQEQRGVRSASKFHGESAAGG